MTTLIGRGPREAGGPLEALLECHERIRQFTTLAIELAGDAITPGARAEAAARVARYFEEALPRHMADEEHDLEPLLATRSGDAALFGLLGVLRRQHERLDAAVAWLVPRWRSLAVGEAIDGAELAALREASEALRDGFDEHLALEEAELVPRARAVLGPVDLATLAAAMRARRSDRTP